MKLMLAIFVLAVSGLAVSAQTDEVKKFGSEADVPRISIEEAKKALDDGSVVFVDARAEEGYRQGHIKGAVSIPTATDEAFRSLPKGKKIVVYCTWPAENSSARLAFKMNEKGIPDVFALKGGLEEWIKAGYPTEKSK